jgi:hypothetical protein
MIGASRVIWIRRPCLPFINQVECMPWNLDDKDKLMSALGYSITTENLDEVQLVMDNLDAIAPNAVTRVQSYLATLAAIETQITTARNATSGVLGQLKGEGRRYVNLVAIAMNLESRNDVYSQ